MNELFFAAMTLLVATSSMIPSSGKEKQPVPLPSPGEDKGGNK